MKKEKTELSMVGRILIKVINLLDGMVSVRDNTSRKETFQRSQIPDSGWEEREAALAEKYIYDYKGGWYNGGTTAIINEGSASSNKVPEKIAKKPIEVLDEVTRPPKVLDLANIDDKIFLLKDKLDFIVNRYSKKEVEGLISLLENRKKYDAAFFNQYQTTDLDIISALCEKYSLVMKTADLFIPEFPKEALDAMKKYDKKVKEITGKRGVYYVIATSEDFKDADNKRDPILLAQSPFGFYYDVLGAWDKEMLLLSEL